MPPVKNLPPVVSATALRAFESTGTGIVWPWIVTVPFGVPKAIVETVTPAALACGGRLRVGPADGRHAVRQQDDAPGRRCRTSSG